MQQNKAGPVGPNATLDEGERDVDLPSSKHWSLGQFEQPDTLRAARHRVDQNELWLSRNKFHPHNVCAPCVLSETRLNTCKFHMGICVVKEVYLDGGRTCSFHIERKKPCHLVECDKVHMFS